MANPEPESDQPPPKKRRLPCSCIGSGFILFILLLPLAVMFMPVSYAVRNRNVGLWEGQAYHIGLAMFACAMDNGGKYPDGKSSTEVFQKLLDRHYVNDPNLFYLPLIGKLKPVPGSPLKPENVGFDVTVNITTDDSDKLPVVFMSGYRVTYQPGSAAVPLTNRYLHGEFQSPWPGWLFRLTEPGDRPRLYMIVCYKGNTLNSMIREEDSIPNFVLPEFDAKGKTYLQLTPDGSLP
jgi:hypothetical protein